jgi:DNA polymerase V
MAEEDKTTGVSIHTGFPNPAADQRLTGLDLNQLLIRHATGTYLFRLRGHEWEGAGVFDGDIALVDRHLDPKKSDVVLWWDEPRGEFAISKLSDMPREASCWGVLTATIHQFRKK